MVLCKISSTGLAIMAMSYFWSVVLYFLNYRVELNYSFLRITLWRGEKEAKEAIKTPSSPTVSAGFDTLLLNQCRFYPTKSHGLL